MGIIMLSDPSGQFESVIFEEGLNRFRDELQVGESVVMLVNADMRPEGISIRIQNVEPIDRVASREPNHMTVFLRESDPLPGIQSLLKRHGQGKVSIVVVQENGARETEIQLKEKYNVSPKIVSAVKAVPGVVDAMLS